MNRALPELLHCLNAPGNLAENCTDMTVLERQRARMKWEQDQQIQQQQQQSFFGGSELISGVFSGPTTQAGHQVQRLLGLVGGCDTALGEAVNLSIKPDPGLESGWPKMGKCEVPIMGFESSCSGGGGLVNSASHFQTAICRTASCHPTVAVAADTKAREATLHEKLSSAAGRESAKKRKADKAHNAKVVVEDDNKEKRIKGNAEEGDSKITEQNSTKNNNNNRESSGDTSKENSKASEVQKPDYIHVRARRGHATDSHSLAERVRREKISERMKYLQDLVPGCNKITSKAGMLDEIINYVQSLQRQVEFLSMKLAAVNPRLDFNIDDLFAKEAFPNCTQQIGMSSEMTNSAYLQFNPVQQLVSCCGLELGINSPDMGLRRTISAPVSVPEMFLDTSCFTQVQPPAMWDTDLQTLLNVEFNQGRSTTTYPPQPFTGPIEASNLKMENM